MKIRKNTRCNTRVIPYRQFRAYRFPNEAEPGYRLQKFLDLALAAAISLGTVTTLLFMLAMSF